MNQPTSPPSPASNADGIAAVASARQRITFSTEKTLSFVSVLELTSIWERSLRRAAIPLRYSQGFNPRPKMNFAAPLPVGCGSEADLLDIWLEQALQPSDILTALQNKTPTNLSIIDIQAINLDEPTLAEQLSSAEYTVWLEGLSDVELEAKTQNLLQSERCLRPRRGKKYRGNTYDLRPLILTMTLTPETMHGWIQLHLHLKARPGATGRPDEVLKAMGVVGCLRRCARTRLILEHNS